MDTLWTPMGYLFRLKEKHRINLLLKSKQSMLKMGKRLLKPNFALFFDNA